MIVNLWNFEEDALFWGKRYKVGRHEKNVLGFSPVTVVNVTQNPLSHDNGSDCSNTSKDL